MILQAISIALQCDWRSNMLGVKLYSSRDGGHQAAEALSSWLQNPVQEESEEGMLFLNPNYQVTDQ